MADHLFEVHLAGPGTDAGRRAGFQALALCSTRHAATVLALLESNDMWIQERAARILGGWRWAQAVEPLERVARHGSHNGRLAAILALRNISTSQSQTVVDSLRRDLGRRYDPYFR